MVISFWWEIFRKLDFLNLNRDQGLETQKSDLNRNEFGCFPPANNSKEGKGLETDFIKL
jgi:hypothetical protein